MILCGLAGKRRLKEGLARTDTCGVKRIASTIFTAALVLRAIDRGLLTLDDQVASISSVTIPAPTGLTVARLLTHTSGLVDYRSAPGYDAAAPLSVTDAVSLSLRAPIIQGAPTQASYANSNYLYLGMLLEQVEGKPFSQLIRELITPLGLTDTRLDEVPQPGWVGFSSGGVMSTTSDLARWGQALLTPGRVLRRVIRRPPFPPYHPMR